MCDNKAKHGHDVSWHDPMTQREKDKMAGRKHTSSSNPLKPEQKGSELEAGGK